MKDDAELLQRYADAGDESAFRELVERHCGLVFSTAVRLVGGDEHLAQDVTQSVFTDLARKVHVVRARVSARREALLGWLYAGTRFAASNLVRAERCRRAYERKAQEMNATLNGETAAGELDWQQLRPVLDEAMGQLSPTDRDAVLSRFFLGHSFKEVGGHLGTGEDAAQKRVARALDRLRVILARRGISSTAAVLGATLASNAVGAVPTSLAAAIASASLTGAAGATAGSGVTVALLQLMNLTNLKTAALCLVVAGIPMLYQTKELASLHAEEARAQSAVAQQEQTVEELKAQQERLNRELRAVDASVAGLAASPRTNLVVVAKPPTATALYGWSEDSPVIRVPKDLLQYADSTDVLTNRQLTDIAIDVLGLNETEVQRVNQILAETFAEYGVVEAAHTRPAEPDPGPLPSSDTRKPALPPGEKKSFVTTLPPEIGTDFRTRLRQDLASVLGETRTSLFGHHTERLFEEMLGTKGTLTKVTTLVRPQQEGLPLMLSQQCFEEGRWRSTLSLPLAEWQKSQAVPAFIGPALAEWAPPSH
jgi:RNA polymerase sigma factor (sigma-70 family)